MPKKKGKSKKKKNSSAALSPKTYLKTRARNLPIYECFISDNWKTLRIPDIVVARKHKNGNITCGLFLVDLFCLGVVDTFFGFNMTEAEYQDFLDTYIQYSILEECDYALVHNIVYGALDFACKYGFQPHREFATTQYLLEEASAEIDHIEIEFGDEGMPCVLTESLEESKDIIKQLDKTAGRGNYKVVYLEANGSDDEYAVADDYYYDDDFDDTIEDRLNAIEKLDQLYEEKFGKTHRPEIKPEFLEYREYKITFEPLKNPNYFSPEEDQLKAEELYNLSRSGSASKARKAIPQLLALMEQFPNNPIYYNYLAIAYSTAGEKKAATEVCKNCYKKFPEYLFAKCNYAQYLLDEQKFEELSAVFDNKFDLQMIYPDRDEFHISEVLTFFATMCRYFIAIDDLATADVYGNLLKEFKDMDNPLKNRALFELTAKKYEKVFGMPLFNKEA
ncbi:MAG: tetratricopeptide repeat protein [bacterium]